MTSVLPMGKRLAYGEPFAMTAMLCSIVRDSGFCVLARHSSSTTPRSCSISALSKLALKAQSSKICMPVVRFFGFVVGIGKIYTVSLKPV